MKTSAGEKYCRGIKGIASSNASNMRGGFDSFLNLWENTKEFFFDIHHNKRTDISSFFPFEIHGIAICWDNSPVYYINLPKDLMKSDQLSMSASGEESDDKSLKNSIDTLRGRWNRIGEIMGKNNVKKFTWNLKVQIQVLKNAAVCVQRFCQMNLSWEKLSPELVDGSHFSLSPVHVEAGIDLAIAAWILSPDEEKSSNPKLDKEVKKRLPVEAVAAADRSGRWKNQMRRAAHNGCCHRVAQIRALHSVLWKLVVSEKPVQSLENIEIPLMNVLADMELWGIGVDMVGCLHARNLLAQKLKHLERKAYEMVGMKFSLYTTADIANVLYGHLKLPIPEGQSREAAS